ncbi:putative hydrolase [Bacillus sp. TS-2]|nr:putative hydrolase [Bacillus sp. TS-2]
MAFPTASNEISLVYKKVKIPTVIVVGEKDPFGTIEMAERLHQDLTNSKLVKLSNVGHMIPENHSEKVIEAVELLNTFNMGDKM